MKHTFDSIKISVTDEGLVNNGSSWWPGSPASVNGQYMQIRSPETERKYYVHRLVGHAFVDNPCPRKYKQIDHIDGDKKNNVATNLRWVSRQLNQFNRLSRNIIYRKRLQKWDAMVRFNFNKYQLGYFEKEDDALETARDFKQLAFHLGYLEPILNDRCIAFWKDSHRAYIHGDKSAFTVAVKRLNSRAGRHRQLRKALVRVHHQFSEGARVLPNFSQELNK